ncbi:MAG: MFS transporter [Coriobacteriales bacterium]|nr:MFS transporter [Coriobacteriales bacterium]
MCHTICENQSFLFLIASCFLFYAFNNVETSAMPEYVLEMGGSKLLASLQTSLFVGVAVILRLFFGPLADARGPRFVMIIGALGFTLPCLFLPFCNHLWQIIVLRVCQAVGLAAYHPCVAHCTSRLCNAETLGKHMGVVRFASTLSLMVGPAVLFPLIAAYGYGVFFGVLCILGFVGFLALLPLDDKQHTNICRNRTDVAPEPESESDVADDRIDAQDLTSQHEPEPRKTPNSYSWLRTLNRSDIALLIYPLICAFGYSVILNFGKLLVQAEMPGINDGLIFTFLSIGGLAGSLGCGVLLDTYTARKTVFACLCMITTGTALLAFAQGILLLAAGSMLFGCGYFGATTVLTATAGKQASPLIKGSFIALQQSCLDCGMVIGSLTAGVIAQAFNSLAVAFVAASIVIAITIPIWLAIAPKQ